MSQSVYTQVSILISERGGQIVKKEIAKNSLITMFIVFIAGCILIFSSSTIGQNYGTKVLERNGGAMDTSQFEQIIDANTPSYRTGATVISFVGGFGFLLSGFVFYKEL